MSAKAFHKKLSELRIQRKVADGGYCMPNARAKGASIARPLTFSAQKRPAERENADGMDAERQAVFV